MACAACIAVAATLPWAGSAAEKLATEDMRLAAFTDVDAFSAIPYYLDILGGNVSDGVAGLSAINGIPGLLAFLGGDINALAPAPDGSGGYAALSALPVFFGTNGVFNGGGVQALSGYAALSAIPVFQNIANATSPTQAIDALSGYAALSAVPVFVGTNGVFTGGGVNALSGYAALSAIPVFFGTGGVFNGGGIDALSGYAALSAIPVFFGSSGVISTGNLSSLAPDAAGNGGYAALSAIPKYLNLPTNPAPAAVQQNATPQVQANLVQDPAPTTTPSTESSSTESSSPKSFVASLPKLTDSTPPAPQTFTPPAPPAPPKDETKVEAVAATTPDNGGQNEQNVQRNSQKFTPKGVGDNPLLFGGGGNSEDNGIRGWGSMLKKAGLGGGAGTG